MQPVFLEAISTINATLPIYARQFETCRSFLQVFEKLETATQLSIDNAGSKDLSQLSAINKLSAECTIVLADLAVICKSYLSAEHDLEKLYFLRQAYLVLFESLIVYDRHNQFLYTTAVSLDASTAAQFSEIAEQIKKFKTEISYHNTIKEKRNEIAGHISDFTTYASLVQEIDSEEVIIMLLTLLDIFKSLQQLVTTLLTRTSQVIAERLTAFNAKADSIKQMLDAITKKES